AMCASRRDRPLWRTTGNTPPRVRHPPIRDRSALCEAIDSRTHSGFVPDRLAETDLLSAGGGAYIARFLRCVRPATGSPQDAHMANTAMYAPPNRFLPQSAIGAYFVKPLIPGHIPASILNE